MPATLNGHTTLLRILGLNYKLIKSTSDDQTEDFFGTFSCVLKTTGQTQAFYALSSADLSHSSCINLSSDSARITLLDTNIAFQTYLYHELNLETGINIIAVLLPYEIVEKVLQYPDQQPTINLKTEKLQEGLKVLAHTDIPVKGAVSLIQDNFFSIQLESVCEIPNGTLITSHEDSDSVTGCGLVVGPEKDTSDNENIFSVYEVVNLFENLKTLLHSVLFQEMCTMGVEENRSNTDRRHSDVVDGGSLHMSCSQEAITITHEPLTQNPDTSSETLTVCNQISKASVQVKTEQHCNAFVEAKSKKPLIGNSEAVHQIEGICNKKSDATGQIQTGPDCTDFIEDENTKKLLSTEYSEISHDTEEFCSSKSEEEEQTKTDQCNGLNQISEQPLSDGKSEIPHATETVCSYTSDAALQSRADQHCYDVNEREKSEHALCTGKSELAHETEEVCKIKSEVSLHVKTDKVCNINQDDKNNQVTLTTRHSEIACETEEGCSNKQGKLCTNDRENENNELLSGISEVGHQANDCQSGPNAEQESNASMAEDGSCVKRRKPNIGKRAMEVKTGDISDGRYIRSFTLGKEGGKCVLKKMGICLIVPENALEKETKIFIGLSKNGNDIPPQGPNGGYMYSPVIVCGPHGLKFQVPIYLIFRHSLVLSSTEDVQIPGFFRSETILCETSDWKPYSGKVIVSRHHMIAVIDGFTKYVWRSLNGQPMQSYRMLRIMIFKETFKSNPQELKISVYPIDAEEGEEQYVRGFARGELIQSEVFLFSDACNHHLTIQMNPGRNCNILSSNTQTVEFEDILSNRQGFRNSCTFTLQTITEGPFQLTAIVSQQQGYERRIEVAQLQPRRGSRTSQRDSGRYSIDSTDGAMPYFEPYPRLGQAEINPNASINYRNSGGNFDTRRSMHATIPEHSQREESDNWSMETNRSSIPAYPHAASEAAPQSSDLQINPQEQQSTGRPVAVGPPNNGLWDQDRYEEHLIANNVPEEPVTPWILPWSLREDIIAALQTNSNVMLQLLRHLEVFDESGLHPRHLLYYIEAVHPSQRSYLADFFESHNLHDISEKLRLHV